MSQPIGGQAVLEGVMMRGASNWSVAIRKPDGNIAQGDLAATVAEQSAAYRRSPPVSAGKPRLTLRARGPRVLDRSAHRATRAMTHGNPAP